MPPSLATALSTNLFHSPCFLGLIVPNRLFTFTRARLKKEIRYSVEGNRTTIEGVHVPSERSGKVLCLDGLGDPRDTDPISRLDLNLTHTVDARIGQCSFSQDVRILSQFLRPDGTILPRKISGISLRSQLLVELLIERARKSGLLPVSIKPSGEHVYQERGRHRFNVYYASDVIGLPTLGKRNKFRYIPPE
ncbi:28S ribosomal protein S18a mitochondrial [Clonorchis sinensis]|uniref:28S ribosomal protein S18a mitochondrial n=1 Tax=Clonorchis sinensis TaxID=79923 RepID=H2KT01_CLOSI|nr:28S ribosomal protein S18a mitochondrial [Clonorchis sinensis]